MSATKTLVVLQPSYLPWLGFFDQLARCDVFVYYDDVQFDKHGWRNRNRIKTQYGPTWLTVPVLHSGLPDMRINETMIDTSKSWVRKQLGTLRQHYAKAPYFENYFSVIEDILLQPWERLVDLNYRLIEEIATWLAIPTLRLCSSTLPVPGDRNSRLVSLCKYFNTTNYLSGNSAQRYLDIEMFARAGIHVEWQNYQHPTYPQLYGDFTPNLSVIDLLFNLGSESKRYFRPHHHTSRGSPCFEW